MYETLVNSGINYLSLNWLYSQISKPSTVSHPFTSKHQGTLIVNHPKSIQRLPKFINEEASHGWKNKHPWKTNIWNSQNGGLEDEFFSSKGSFPGSQGGNEMDFFFLVVNLTPGIHKNHWTIVFTKEKNVLLIWINYVAYKDVVSIHLETSLTFAQYG